MFANLPPGTDAAYDGVNKYGRGAKDKLEDSDHRATDGLVNVFGDDQPHLRPGAYHPGDHTDVAGVVESTDGDNAAPEAREMPRMRHVTTSEHNAPPTPITPGRLR